MRSTAAITMRSAARSAICSSRGCSWRRSRPTRGVSRSRFAARDLREAHPAAPAHFRDDGSTIRTAGQVVEQWEQIKAREQKEAGSDARCCAACRRRCPSLLRAHEIGTRVAAVGFDWAKTTDVVDKIEEEVAELPRRHRARKDCRASRRRDGRSALLDRQLVQKARHRAGIRAAESQCQVQCPLRDARARLRAARTLGSRCDAGEMEAQWQAIAKSIQRQPVSSCTSRRLRRRIEESKSRRRKEVSRASASRLGRRPRGRRQK